MSTSKPTIATEKPTAAKRSLARGAVVVAAATGLLFGLGLFGFSYAEGLSYFSTDPRACANCHIMRSQYDSWQKASHHTVAKCVDCHLPEAFIPKYLAKASNGWHHSKGFTLQDFAEPITIKPGNAAILQANCLRCHEPMVAELVGDAHAAKGGVECVHCHANVGHGERAGLGGALTKTELATQRP